MRGGIWVLTIFAAIWATGGIMMGRGPTWLAPVPVIISVAMLLWARRRPMGAGTPVEGDHVGRVVGIATAVEGVAIFVVANILFNMHMTTLLLPAVAIIVGLHFLPLARWIPVPLYYRTGAALIIVGVTASFMPPETRAIVTGIAAAMVLWVSCFFLVRGGRG